MNELERKIEQLEKYIEVKEQECDDLQDRIDEAIEYIEEATKYQRGMGLEPLDEIYAENIIDILKGDNK